MLRQAYDDLKNGWPKERLSALRFFTQEEELLKFWLEAAGWRGPDAIEAALRAAYDILTGKVVIQHNKVKRDRMKNVEGFEPETKKARELLNELREKLRILPGRTGDPEDAIQSDAARRDPLQGGPGRADGVPGSGHEGRPIPG